MTSRIQSSLLLGIYTNLDRLLHEANKVERKYIAESQVQFDVYLRSHLFEGVSKVPNESYVIFKKSKLDLDLINQSTNQRVLERLEIFSFPLRPVKKQKITERDSMRLATIILPFCHIAVPKFFVSKLGSFIKLPSQVQRLAWLKRIMFIVFNSAKRKSSLSTKALAGCNRVPEIKIIFSKIAIEETLNRGIDQRNHFEQHQANCTFKCCHAEALTGEHSLGISFDSIFIWEGIILDRDESRATPLANRIFEIPYFRYKYPFLEANHSFYERKELKTQDAIINDRLRLFDTMPIK
uniref:Uncharacterized protein n=1 Tax=Glossina palpalis gambiensis TaxID=67801 RepID=A0A1B0AQ95_9MUSC